MTATAFWRRLDTPGHDACRVSKTNNGWRLHGGAVFRHELGPAQIEYLVDCDAEWRSRVGEVQAWIGDRNWRLRIERTASGRWRFNDVWDDATENCKDLDFGFTPATNLLQLQRVDMPVGASAEIPVAWLDLPEASLRMLPQYYERRSENTYWYEAPTAGYSGLLEIAESGFVRSYPQLWLMED